MLTTTPDLVRPFDVQLYREGGVEHAVDSVAVEEPLEIRVSYWFKSARQTGNLAVTMRTPGSDLELAAGLLLAEGVVRSSRDIVELRSIGSGVSNEVLVELSGDVDFEGWRLARNSVVNSSCGVCGKAVREAIFVAEPLQASRDSFRIRSSVIESLPGRLQEDQCGFAQTGGLHAAALVTADGRIEKLFEDIGRHNALDKLIGWCLLNGRTPLSDRMLFMSSRSSFELVQKAVMAGAPVLAAVGSSSSLAIESAREYGMTLLGFVRGARFNVYTGGWRINSK
jgi:FdhD protein